MFGLLRLLRLLRLFRLLRLLRLLRLFGLLRLLRLLGLLRLLRLLRLFRLFRLGRRRRFEAILPERVVGLLAIHRRGRLRGQHGQHAAGDHVVHDIQPLVNRARKAALQKRHFGVQLARFAHQLELSRGQRGDFVVAEHAFIHPVNGVAHRVGHRRDRQIAQRAVGQRNDDLHRQRRAFRRGQLLRAGQRRGRRQHGAERESRQPADDFFHLVSSFTGEPRAYAHDSFLSTVCQGLTPMNRCV